ncbi:hypothetical protein PVK06_030758 [Gossypium arboreum]|uniref:MORF/ORRM1/DAG-like MORF domain-containing protein n=1 Tax=Gossypium arboreum TaxID=29729 RepID=A0ABR0NP49_GOSAR|nr:hypothetical protein PVK06_030758 [Gossypium arboreum]
MALLFPGCDYEHWLIVMDKPGGEGATKQEMIDCYIKTLAKVVGSEEEAKKKIYNVSCERYFGFGCEIDEETSNKLEGLPGVLFVLPDSYVDPEYKDYGVVILVPHLVHFASHYKSHRSMIYVGLKHLQLSCLLMARLFKGHLNDKGGLNHNPREPKTDQVADMGGAEVTGGAGGQWVVGQKSGGSALQARG